MYRLKSRPSNLTSAFARLQLHQAVAEGLSFAQLEADLSVGVQPKRKRRLRRHGVLNVLKHLRSGST
jgi:hypothetical protein